jgi:hypothetical protein
LEEELPPTAPQPRVSAGNRFVVAPIPPSAAGVFTRNRDTGICRANFLGRADGIFVFIIVKADLRPYLNGRQRSAVYYPDRQLPSDELFFNYDLVCNVKRRFERAFKLAYSFFFVKYNRIPPSYINSLFRERKTMTKKGLELSFYACFFPLYMLK